MHPYSSDKFRQLQHTSPRRLPELTLATLVPSLANAANHAISLHLSNVHLQLREHRVAAKLSASSRGHPQLLRAVIAGVQYVVLIVLSRRIRSCNCPAHYNGKRFTHEHSLPHWRSLCAQARNYTIAYAATNYSAILLYSMGFPFDVKVLVPTQSDLPRIPGLRWMAFRVVCFLTTL